MSSSARCVEPLKGQVPEVWIREHSLSFESPVKVRLWVSWSVTHAFAFSIKRLRETALIS